jgi:hypothetical protein
MNRWMGSIEGTDTISMTGHDASLYNFIVVENDRDTNGLGLGRLNGMREAELRVVCPEADIIEVGLQRTWFGFKKEPR